MLRLLILPLLLLAACQTTPNRPSANTGPWNLPQLSQPPHVTWGTISTNDVQQLHYEGEPFNGKPTRVFAYLARPKSDAPNKKFPAVVLVHGGGGKAFKDWAEHWARRGYVAISMDLAGNGADGKRMPDGGPDQSDEYKFRNFNSTNITDAWSYHAVANVIRAHSLLTSLPEVDADRTAITGISWGGYLTCIVAGLDHRFKAAVPVYGCGFLGDNSVWRDGSLARMTPDSRALWLQTFDPSQYLPNVRRPILFLNGSHDFAYPMDSYQKSYRLVRPEHRHVSVVMKLPHGHIWTFPEVDQFIDRALAHKKFPELLDLKTSASSVTVASTSALTTAELNYTTNTGPWQQRVWTTKPAKITNHKIEAELPTTSPITYFITATTTDNLRISSEHAERPEPTE